MESGNEARGLSDAAVVYRVVRRIHVSAEHPRSSRHNEADGFQVNGQIQRWIGQAEPQGKCPHSLEIDLLIKKLLRFDLVDSSSRNVRLNPPCSGGTAAP
jgi:hypothetical protein